MRTRDGPAFAYMQARIQARHGERLSAEQWQQLEASRDLGHCLQLLHQTSLRGMVRHLSPEDLPASWERSLRRDWNRYVDQVSAWAPEKWREMLYWLHLLPVLPGIAHVLAGRDPLPWMQQDDFFLPLDMSNSERFRNSLQASPWGALLPQLQTGHPVLAWLNALHTVFPRGEQESWTQLLGIWSRIEGHLFESPESRSSWREGLEKEFISLIRKQARTVFSLLGHIGLVSLDTQRLRAKLLSLYLADYRARPLA